MLQLANVHVHQSMKYSNFVTMIPMVMKNKCTKVEDKSIGDLNFAISHEIDCMFLFIQYNKKKSIKLDRVKTNYSVAISLLSTEIDFSN